jgi:hypothetical protein
MKIISLYGKGIYVHNLTSLSPKSKLEDFMEVYFFLFFRKIVIILLKCRLSTLERTICFFGGYKQIRGMWGLRFPIK